MNEKNVIWIVTWKDYLWHLLLSFCLEQKHHEAVTALLSSHKYSVYGKPRISVRNSNTLTEISGWSFKSEWPGENWVTGPAENLQSSTEGGKLCSWGRSTGRISTCWKQLGSYSKRQLHTRQQCTSVTAKANHINGLHQEEQGQQSRGWHFLLLHSTGEAAAGELHQALDPCSKKNMGILERVQ